MFLLFLFIYVLAGLLIGCCCGVINDCYPYFWGKAFDAQPETNQIVLLITFWPIFFTYLIGWCVVWYIKFLYISIRDLFKSSIKIK